MVQRAPSPGKARTTRPASSAAGVRTQWQPDEVGLREWEMPALQVELGHHSLAFGDEGVNPVLQLVERVQARDRGQ
jgi:hypothetical protein